MPVKTKNPPTCPGGGFCDVPYTECHKSYMPPLGGPAVQQQVMMQMLPAERVSACVTGM